MDYERIDKPQTGIISPSKLRMKLLGVSNQRKKEGSNCNSSRTSPSKLEDYELSSNSLLASNNEDFDDTISSLETPSLQTCSQSFSSSMQNQKSNCPTKENIDAGNNRVNQASSRDDNSGNSSAVHPLKSYEDENLDYDSNASSSSFEFHKGGERMVHSRSLTRSLSRPTSYKWNDAEKWIMNKQAIQASYSKSHSAHSTGNRMNMMKVAPETKRVDFGQPVTAHMSLERFNFAHNGAEPFPVVQSNVVPNASIDLYPQSKDLNEVDSVKNSTHDDKGTSGVRAISMRDMGTEMTPIPSQEPSRTATPVGATTPLRSPTSSIPSTPRGGDPAVTPVECKSHSNSQMPPEKGNKVLSEEELKLKTRREIVALGVQLGKMNIAAWASKAEEKKTSAVEVAELEELERVEFEKRAAAWEEAEKTKHAARYKREEIKIQAWECQQKAKLEEELRRIEAKVEQLRTHSQAKMVKRIAIARKKSEEKRAAAEARKKRQAEKAAAQAEYIRQTGRAPPSDYICCGVFFS